jgi:hypothetical protein
VLLRWCCWAGGAVGEGRAVLCRRVCWPLGAEQQTHRRVQVVEFEGFPKVDSISCGR